LTPGLLPAPRSLERTGGSLRRDAARAPEPRVERDGALPAEGYRLEVSPRGVHIRCADERGERWARGALAQLARHSPVEIPCLRLLDWPDLPVRGYMLDVSRDRVPTRATLERLLCGMELLRLNQLQLYTEHSFAYREHETVWRDASPLTHDDMRWLDARCRGRGIELVANQNCFGHMERWLRHPEYRALAEAPDGFELPGFGPRRASVIAPSDEGLEFVLALCRELLACTTSRWINIGCDETWELGQGRSRDACAAQGRGAVYSSFLCRLIERLHADGHAVQFWGDVGREHAEQIDRLPRRDTRALVWGYEAPVAPDAIPDAVAETMGRLGWTREALSGFSALVRPFAEREFPFWVCPGTSSWNSLLGRWSNARANLIDAAIAARSHGAGGYLITDWGDNGHLQPPSVSWLPLAFGAALAWGLVANRELDVAPLLDLHLFDDGERELGRALETLGDLYLEPGLPLPNASALHAALLRSGVPGAESLAADALERTLARLDDGVARIERSRPRVVDGTLAKRELLQAARLARHGAWRLARAAGLPCPSSAELRRDLGAAIEEQRSCWLARSRPGGLAQSLARLERPLEQYT
jgi:hypothetical protein